MGIFAPSRPKFVIFSDGLVGAYTFIWRRKSSFTLEYHRRHEIHLFTSYLKCKSGDDKKGGAWAKGWTLDEYHHPVLKMSIFALKFNIQKTPSNKEEVILSDPVGPLSKRARTEKSSSKGATPALELAADINNVLRLSLQTYGCGVIQKSIEVVDVDQEMKIVKGLDGHVMRCARDQNGSLVIQKCIECIPKDYIKFMISSFFDEVVNLSIHPYGRRIIQVLSLSNKNKMIVLKYYMCFSAFIDLGNLGLGSSGATFMIDSNTSSHKD